MFDLQKTSSIATRTLALLLVVVYLATAISSGHVWDLPADDLLRFGGAYGPAMAAGESWRLMTAVFLHGGVLHLAFNLLALNDLGSALEQRFGRLRVVLVFLSTGIAGYLASTLWHPEDVSIGASGAIFGLLGWWAVAAWNLGEFLPATQRRRRLMTLFMIVGIALGLGFLLPGVDNAAHLGGLLSGLLLGWVALHRPRLLLFAAPLVAMLAVAGIQALPAELAVDYQESIEFDRRYTTFAQEDRAISQSLLTLGEDSRKGHLSDTEALTRLESNLLPRLAAQRDRLKPPYSSARIESQRQHWERYAQLRLEAVQSIHGAVTGREPDGLLRFESKMTEATRLAKEPPRKP